MYRIFNFYLSLIFINRIAKYVLGIIYKPKKNQISKVNYIKQGGDVAIDDGVHVLNEKNFDPFVNEQEFVVGELKI